MGQSHESWLQELACAVSCVGCVIETEMSDLVFKLFERVLQGEDAAEKRAL